MNDPVNSTDPLGLWPRARHFYEAPSPDGFRDMETGAYIGDGVDYPLYYTFDPGSPFSYGYHQTVGWRFDSRAVWMPGTCEGTMVIVCDEETGECEEWERVTCTGDKWRFVVTATPEIITLDAVTATLIFWKNYGLMLEARGDPSDKYFHCMAHCEAARLGPTGLATGVAIGVTREVTDRFRHTVPWWDTTNDMVANMNGLIGAVLGGVSCEEACSAFK